MSESHSPSPVSGSHAEYDHLLSYFKYLITLTTLALGVLIAFGAYLFYSNMHEVREEARQEATRVATAEAKASVTQAFEEKNINALILAAAQQKVGTITDKLIEQQLTSKLSPIENRILLIGRISESEARMRLAFRSGLDEIKEDIRTTSDPDVVRFGRSTLATTTADYETRSQDSMKRSGLKGVQFLQAYAVSQQKAQQAVPSSIHDVVQIIRQDDDLNFVAAGFLAFRDLTGEDIKMFDFDAVTSWCSKNQNKCQTP